MRLTLRTLLAYLDDILPPNETRELGAKIAQTPRAAELAERIRDVIRKRRLTAPGVHDESALDPNQVAEYLDNTLMPEEVAEIEQICLDSDLQLAEVAACHQVLGLVLGQPIDVPDTIRERAYRIGMREDSHIGMERLESDSHVINKKSTKAVASKQSDHEVPTKPAETSGPHVTAEQVQSTQMWKRILPYSLLGALAVGWLALIYFDPSIVPGIEKEKDLKQTGVKTPEPSSPTGAETAGEETIASADDAEPEVTTELVASVDTTTPATAEPVSEPATTPAEPVELASVTPTEKQLPASVPSEPETPLTVPETPPIPPSLPTPAPTSEPTEEPKPVTPEPTAAEKPVEPPPTETATVQFHYLPGTGLVLHHDEENADWLRTPDDAVLKVPHAVAVPVPFSAEFEVMKSPFRMKIEGGSDLLIEKPNPAGEIALQLIRGQMLLTAKDFKAGESTPKVAMNVRGRWWRLEPLTPETELAVEVRPLSPRGRESVQNRPSTDTTWFLVRGNLRIIDDSDAIRVLAPGEGLSWETEVATAAPTPVTIAPEWIMASAPTEAVQQRARPFADSFPLDQPIGLSLSPSLSDRRYFISEWTAHALGLTGTLEPLVSVLQNSPHNETITAAAEELRVNLVLDPEADKRVQEAISTVFPSHDAELVMQLLWGVSDDDARDLSKSLALIAALDHEQSSIRQLAFDHIVRLTGRQMNYRPTFSATQRVASLRRWQDYVEKQGGLLPAVE
ncbi:hypothetical protein [Calycomorphotria hydatis]|uniref:Uncharacterized protein n=1 Tax=Calycomorphotria hydatis TaxID=2528027 RepID=A0A517T5N2_9PLAN|nr:hypothetical protein [Calycomorphotria hydatis]QDT63679.1 hypothetical protein V22_09030 [Calycomorphotria hydatis]